MGQYFQRTIDALEAEREASQEPVEPQAGGSRLAGLGDRIARAFSSFDRAPVDRPALEPADDSTVDFAMLEEAEPEVAARFPVGRFGYSRAAVDEYIVELERELDELRRERPGAGLSITEEIERIGEQTASILVVAHDQAHETTRLAQEQADRCIADAAANAVAVTEQARQQLRDLDNETDAVWRERRRLIEDAQSTGQALIGLATEASGRFPEETKFAADPVSSRSD